MLLSPSYLSIFYTTRCNSRCTTCRWWSRPPVTLRAGTLERLPIFIDPQNIDTIYITGGEPLLSPSVIDVAYHADRLKPGVSVVCDTNGLDPELYMVHVRAILSRDINLKVGVSLNGRRRTHNETRGRLDAYACARRMAFDLHSINALWQLSLVQVPETKASDIQHVQDLARRWNVGYSYSPFRVSPRLGFDAAVPVPLFDCAGVQRTICINPNGDITPCEEGGRPEIVLGNLRDAGLDQREVDRVTAIVRSRGCQPCGNPCAVFHL